MDQAEHVLVAILYDVDGRPDVTRVILEGPFADPAEAASVLSQLLEKNPHGAAFSRVVPNENNHTYRECIDDIVKTLDSITL